VTSWETNVPRREREIAKVSRVEGNTIKIVANDGSRQIIKLKKMKRELQVALNEQREVPCIVTIRRNGRITVLGLALAP
jgi:hypothetical protein